MATIKSYDLGWMVTGGIHVSHFFRTNDQSKAAVSHCGLMLPKVNLKPYRGTARCGYCCTVQDEKDSATAAQQQAISPHKPLPEGVQSGEGEQNHE